MRKLIGGIALVAVCSTLAWGRPGTVVTKDNKVYTGEVTETGDSVDIAGVSGASGPVDIKAANVATISYKVADDVYVGLKKLGPNDNQAKLLLAQAAIDAHAYEAARDALNDLLMHDPSNTDARQLMQKVQTLLPAPAAAEPATRPTAATKPAAPAPNSTPGPYIVKRPITPAEINHLRQLEWRGDSSDPVRLRIDAETRRKFVTNNPDVTPADFNRLPLDQQAKMILDKGTPALQAGVVIGNDPASMADFKKSVNRPLLQSCATVGCHVGAKPGIFTLLSGNSDAAIYTNFLVIMRTSYVDKTGVHQMVDRQTPENSALLQFILPGDSATLKHPTAMPARNIAKSDSDPRYAMVRKWIENLNPIAPKYDVDLSKEASKPEKSEGK